VSAFHGELIGDDPHRIGQPIQTLLTLRADLKDGPAENLFTRQPGHREHLEAMLFARGRTAPPYCSTLTAAVTRPIALGCQEVRSGPFTNRSTSGEAVLNGESEVDAAIEGARRRFKCRG
jgi:hypothetical protein